MKKTKLVALLTAVLCSATPVMSVSAATLSDVTVDNSTTVRANIEGPGAISYVVTIPSAVDFGTLTIPEDTDSDHYAFADFNVEATELKINANQGVTVYMKDSTSADNQFYISQQGVDEPFKIQYDVYDTTVNADNVLNYDAINTTAEPGSYGYHLCTFVYGSTGSTQPVTLALNQNSLYGKDGYEIAGDYSGTITFHSALFERN